MEITPEPLPARTTIFKTVIIASIAIVLILGGLIIYRTKAKKVTPAEFNTMFVQALGDEQMRGLIINTLIQLGMVKNTPAEQTAETSIEAPAPVIQP